MRRRVHRLMLCLVVLCLAACSAAHVAIAPDAPRVRTGTTPPDGPSEQLGAITATHGGGCGLYGTRGNLEGAYTILRNKAATLGADYVQVLRVTAPHHEGPCLVQAFVIDGLAYRLAPRPAASNPPPLPAASTRMLPPPGLTPASLADAVARVTPSVVRVETDLGDRGSGFIVNPDGGILTAAHVIEGATVIVVVLSDGTRTSATVRARDTDADVALLTIPRTNLRAAPIASAQTLRAGDEVAVIGAPLGLARTVTKGIVSAIRVRSDGVTLIQTDAAMNHGNSGGPVITLRGEVVGISRSKLVGAEVQGLGFAIAADTALVRLGLAIPAPQGGTGPALPVTAQHVAALASVTGTYTGNISGMQAGRGFAMTVTFTMVQQGDRVSATWTTSGGTAGTAAGRLSGNEILEFLATQLSPCPGLLRGSIAIENQGARLLGAYAGDGCGMPVSASFVVTRQ